MTESDREIDMHFTQEEIENDKNNFNSTLGDFTHVQDRIIRYGRSKLMILYTSLILIVFLCSLITLVYMLASDLSVVVGSQTKNYNWLKLLVILVIFIASIIPIGFSMITLGCVKANKKYIIKGINLFDQYLTFIKVATWVSLVPALIASVIALTRSFMLFILFVLLFGIAFFVFLSFVNKAKAFLNSLKWSFSKNSKLSRSYPTVANLKPYIIGYLVVTIINLINQSANPRNILFIPQSLIQLDNLSSIIQIAASICMILIVSTFDSFIKRGKSIKKIPVNDRIDSYTN